MNRRQKIIVSVTGIFLVLLLLVGLTYAYFLTKINGNENTKSISVTTANLALVYGDGNGIISAEKIEPGTTLDTKTFTVKNEGNDKTDYVVVIEDVKVTNVSDGSTTTFESNDFIYTLTCTEGCNGVDSETTFPMTGGILVGNSIEVGKTHTYELTVTYKETGLDQSNDMNKKLEAKVNIADIKALNPYKSNTNSLAYNIINNALINKDGTELLATPKTKVAEEISSSNPENENEKNISINMNNIGAYASTADDAYNCYNMGNCNNGAVLSTPNSCSDIKNKYVYISNMNKSYYVDGCDGETPYYTISAERTISTTLDDYGTSYYYRGNVEDNYVNFAGMCWRIVRIDGNGNTKLILEDQDEVCSTTMNGNWDIEASDGTSITLNGTEPYRTGNFGYDDSTSKYKMSYLNPVDNSNRAMVNAFKYFQTNTLTNKINSTYENKSLSDLLVSGNWCLNNKAYSDSIGTTLLENPTYTSTFYYDSFVRLNGKTTKEPTLKCPVETMETFGDNITPMYVGTLTADEIVYAGGKVYESDPNYLINKWQNINSKYFWSLSPSDFDSYGGDAIFGMYVNGSLNSFGSVDSEVAFRPSVSLREGIEIISGGDGTINNPYELSDGHF